MRIAVYSITRDRLDYTKHCFASLREKAGQDFDHYLWDNHSEDGTKEWLLANLDDFAYVNLAASNYGIAQASNELIKVIKQRGPYDLIIKMDNDCEVVSDDILAKIAARSEEHTSESSHQIISYAVFCLKKKKEIKIATIVVDERALTLSV